MEDQQRVAIETLYRAVICNITTRYCTNVVCRGVRTRGAEKAKREEGL